MIRVRYCLCLFLGFLFIFSFAQPSRELQLPLKFVNGYGPFNVDKGYLTFSPPPSTHPLYKSWAPLQFKGIPSALHNVEKAVIWTDFLQFLYQNVQIGNLAVDVYAQFREEGQITTTENNLSRQPIACYVLVVKGIDASGKEVLLIDRNHDGNFADETPIFVPEYTSDKDFEEGVKRSIQVNYEAVYKKQIIDRVIPLIVLKNHDRYFYSFPQYALAELKQKSSTLAIAVSHEFRFPNYEITDITLLSGQKQSIDSIARKNQFLMIDGHTFKNKGVDFAHLSLMLEEVNAPLGSLPGTQKGMQAISFEGKEAISGNKIALTDFKGKYLFIDFWGTWCGPCVGQLQKLTEIYSKVDKTKVAFVGIAGKDDLESLRKMIGEKNILWPNILSDQANRIVEKYNIMMYPTGLLIDPNGKLIETNVYSFNLEELLNKYL